MVSSEREKPVAVNSDFRRPSPPCPPLFQSRMVCTDPAHPVPSYPSCLLDLLHTLYQPVTTTKHSVQSFSPDCGRTSTLPDKTTMRLGNFAAMQRFSLPPRFPCQIRQLWDADVGQPWPKLRSRKKNKFRTSYPTLCPGINFIVVSISIT